MTLRPYSPLPPLAEIAGGPCVIRRRLPLEYNLAPNMKNQLLRSGKVIIERKQGNTNHYLLISLLYEAIRLKEEWPMRGMEVNWPMIQQDYELLIAGEEVRREGIIQPEAIEEETGEPEPSGDVKVGNVLLEEQIKFLEGFHIPQELAERAKNAQSIGKALGELIRSTENQMRVLKHAGRVVDVREVEALIRLCLEDLIAEIVDLPNSYAEQLAEDLDADIRVAKAALESVSRYLGDVARLNLDKVGRETASFMQSKQSKK